jgi:hypothetical protein
MHGTNINSIQIVYSIVFEKRYAEMWTHDQSIM